MTIYIYENTDPTEAAAFTASDFLVFANTSVTALNIGVALNAASGLSNGNITLTVGGTSLAFPAAALSAASATGNIQFDNGSSLVLGTSGGDSLAGGTAIDDVIYGFAGNDSLGSAGDTSNDYLYGGLGNDTLLGGGGNDHLYGNALTTAQGTADGADSILAGDGADYIQGNAGNDFLDGGTGSDRIFGGSGNDTIVGGADTDTVNGNTGDDSIDGGTGNDILRGGQGNDIILGGADTGTGMTLVGGGNDILYGDLGNDTLVGGTGFDVLFGGDGNDVFRFAAGDAPVTNITSGGSNIVDVIGDYVDGTDKITLGSAVPASVLLDTTGTTFGTLQAALTYAQQLADNTTAANSSEVVALNFGGDTYLFATLGTGATAIDTAIKVIGVSPTVFTTSDFIV